MSSDIAIKAERLRKTYHLYPSSLSRLKQILAGGRRQYYKEFVALHEASFELRQGEVLGLVGRNGAGKSTLLQLICGTLTPTSGTLSVRGRIAALLELGAGFNPDFTGRENIYLSGALMGLSHREIDSRMEQIIDFSGIRPFIDQPVKTYSSGMYVRLAFSVATSVDPDILVIDEALSVGDGDFSRRSFDRIMELRDAGKTILFCSHSIYQLEVLCSRAIWMEAGRIVESGEPGVVVENYQSFLDRLSLGESPPLTDSAVGSGAGGAGATRITRTRVSVDGIEGQTLHVKSAESNLKIEVEFVHREDDRIPGVAITIHAASGLLVSSSGSWNDGVQPVLDEHGVGRITLEYRKVPLLRGRYTIGVLLFCEQGIYLHDEIDTVATLEVRQEDAERGMVRLPHRWHPPKSDSAEESAPRPQAVEMANG